MKPRRMTQKFLIVWMGVVAIGLFDVSIVWAEPPPHPQKMTREEWERFQNRDKVAEAIGVLDDPNWHKSDPWIRYQREADSQQPGHLQRGVDDLIQDREVSAIGTVTGPQLPAAERKRLFEKYMDHPNQQVATLAVRRLITEKHWSIPEAKEYASRQGGSDGWGLLLWALPADTPADERKSIARENLRLLTAEPRRDSPYYFAAGEISAIRELVNPPEPRDYDMIRAAVGRYPDAALLWAAVSRLPPDEAIEHLARKVYSDASRPAPLRGVAGLTLGKRDPRIMDELYRQTETALKPVASEDSPQRLKDALRAGPTSAESAAYYQDSLQAQGFLAVLYDLPSELVKSHAPDLYRYRYGGIGSGVCAILARRVPDVFVSLVADQGDLPEESRGALLIAEHFEPTVETKVRTLLAPEQRRVLEKQRAEHGVRGIAGTAASLTLWD